MPIVCEKRTGSGWGMIRSFTAKFVSTVATNREQPRPAFQRQLPSADEIGIDADWLSRVYLI
jgi:hypothetical protein